MTREDVLAVVVSFNGLARTRETVEALRPQVGAIFVVDNGSEAPSLDILASLEEIPGVSIVRQGVNRGIGNALNVGVARARERGAAWLLTMDQDSLVEPGFIRAYQEAIADGPSHVSLSPRIEGVHVTPGQGVRVVGSAITSGNLVKVSLFDEVGLYDEPFFIDCVDFDFCLRVRRAGHSIHRVLGAVMRHQLGERREVPGLLRRYYAEHSPLRRYYMARNFMYIAERYGLRFPLFILKLAAAHLLLLVLIGFYDPRPWRSYKASLRGLLHYCARRSGPLVEPAR